MTLYHGSFCEVQRPDLLRCAPFKDFGRGFYLTSFYEQAESFSGLSTRKAIANELVDEGQKYGVVSVFSFIERKDIPLNIHSFLTADTDWLHCVVGHRKKGTFPDVVSTMEMYDIICGKIANDNTNATITAYIAGAYGEISTVSADNLCISFLLPERLENQFCFRTKNALSRLRFERSKKIWL